MNGAEKRKPFLRFILNEKKCKDDFEHMLLIAMCLIEFR